MLPQISAVRLRKLAQIFKETVYFSISFLPCSNSCKLVASCPLQLSTVVVLRASSEGAPKYGRTSLP